MQYFMGVLLTAQILIAVGAQPTQMLHVPDLELIQGNGLSDAQQKAVDNNIQAIKERKKERYQFTPEEKLEKENTAKIEKPVVIEQNWASLTVDQQHAARKKAKDAFEYLPLKEKIKMYKELRTLMDAQQTQELKAQEKPIPNPFYKSI